MWLPYSFSAISTGGNGVYPASRATGPAVIEERDHVPEVEDHRANRHARLTFFCSWPL
jgi:hypothetical protein